jgi:hypothetical protein
MYDVHPDVERPDDGLPFLTDRTSSNAVWGPISASATIRPGESPNFPNRDFWTASVDSTPCGRGHSADLLPLRAIASEGQPFLSQELINENDSRRLRATLASLPDLTLLGNEKN